MHHSESVTIDTNAKFELEYIKKIQLLLMSTPVNRGAAHAMKDDTTATTHELMYVTESFDISPFMSAAQSLFKPNLPWAEDHFQERVSGDPMNPSPSEAWWPFARQGNAEHKSEEQFSHTYPERFWPRFANEGGKMKHSRRVVATPIVGIRFEYGDLRDLIEVLKRNPKSRQAYLPIWFPEDLNAASHGERVPCSMGYHFIMNQGQLDCVYTLRSCDIVRFYRDDMYMAARLLQWVAAQVDLGLAQQGAGSAADIQPGKLVVHIDNLHCFPGDRPFLENLLRQASMPSEDKRVGYNYGAMY
jgi:hypothetical protein